MRSPGSPRIAPKIAPGEETRHNREIRRLSETVEGFQTTDFFRELAARAPIWEPGNVDLVEGIAGAARFIPDGYRFHMDDRGVEIWEVIYWNPPTPEKEWAIGSLACLLDHYYIDMLVHFVYVNDFDMTRDFAGMDLYLKHLYKGRGGKAMHKTRRL